MLSNSMYHCLPGFEKKCHKINELPIPSWGGGKTVVIATKDFNKLALLGETKVLEFHYDIILIDHISCSQF